MSGGLRSAFSWAGFLSTTVELMVSNRPLSFPSRSAAGELSAQCHVDGRFRQFLPKAALIKLRHQRTLELVAFIDESQPEREADIVEDVGGLRPDNHRTRAHDGGNIAVHEGVARQIRDPHH